LLLSLHDYQNDLKEYATSIRNKLDGGFVFVLNEKGERTSIIACAGNKAVENGIMCGKIISQIAASHNGKGGGKPDLAQGGIDKTDPNTVLSEVEKLIAAL
ncbi:MAG: hypothetical protein IKS69_05335, partial [Erysipelotrichaceae bacterium]|nr:hypothetical protein [Erysipelotrichaceae bacterium]